jgi:hypothetical protein
VIHRKFALFSGFSARFPNWTCLTLRLFDWNAAEAGMFLAITMEGFALGQAAEGRFERKASRRRGIARSI